MLMAARSLFEEALKVSGISTCQANRDSCNLQTVSIGHPSGHPFYSDNDFALIAQTVKNGQNPTKSDIKKTKKQEKTLQPLRLQGF